MISVTNSNPSVAPSATYQFELANNSSGYVEFGIGPGDPTGSTITRLGLFTAGPNAGVCPIVVKRYDGESISVTATVT